MNELSKFFDSSFNFKLEILYKRHNFDINHNYNLACSNRRIKINVCYERGGIINDR